MSLSMKYAMKKRAKKMADGGEVEGDEADTTTSTTGNKTKTGGSNPGGASTGGAGTVTITTGKNPPKAISVSNVGGKTDAANAGGMDPSDADDDMMMAQGGMVDPNMQDADMIARIMHKRKMYSEGGMVANDDGPIADDKPAMYDDLVLRDDLESSYTGANSGDELGNGALDEREQDLIARIMKSRAKKDRMPRPA